MRFNRAHAVTDPADELELTRELIAEHPWATIVSNGPTGLVASHYPVLLDEPGESGSDAIVLVTHVGRPDERKHGFGKGHEVLVVFQGHHGYVSPSWYAAKDSQAPTWNFTAAHLHGVPDVLDPDDNLAVLTRLVAHFEQHVDDPMWLDPEYGERVARGTVGLRIPIDRVELKVKMSQDKHPESRAEVLRQLRGDGPFAHRPLADDMDRALARGIGLGDGGSPVGS